MATIEKQFIHDIPVLSCSPKGKTPKPLVLLSHGFSRSKHDWEGKLEQLAEQGYYAVALDNRLHGERIGPNFNAVAFVDGKLDIYEIRKAIKATADDVKVLIEYFSQRQDIQADRIGMTGVSMGGYTTFRALVVDPRITVAAPIIGSPYWDDVPENVPLLQTPENTRQLQDYAKAYSPANALDVFYPRAILMQNGRKDPHFALARIEQFYQQLQAAYQQEPAKVQLIIHDNVGHDFTETMWEHVLDWFQKYL